MDFDLVVTEAFGRYAKGARITRTAEKRRLDGHPFVVRVAPQPVEPASARRSARA